jgi:glutamate formiminotransferase/formiminotetrahydrofolate cyclodeaminase
MEKIVECVPNFSEGRDAAKIAEIVAAIRTVEGILLLDVHLDADHNRSVITFAGEPEAVLEAALRAARRAVDLIDLNDHVGEHPRLGALDVLPFIPLRNVTMDECVALARRAGERLARELKIPVYLYEQAALRPERRDLADVRRGEFEGLREGIVKDPQRAPDFGEPRLHPTAGATAVGARRILIAYNINLATDDLVIARRIARAVRGRDGGLRYLKALGIELRGRGIVQVSMNLVDYECTPVPRVFEAVRREAERYGVGIVGSEIVGLIPQAALDAAADYYLRLENFSAGQVLEARLNAAMTEANRDHRQAAPARFLDEIASGNSTPGGGSAAAYVGALGVALGAMVCHLTLGRSKYAAVEGEAGEILAELGELRIELERAVDEDAESFARVRAARALPQETEAERLARTSAIEQAVRGALAVPTRVAEQSLAALELLDELAEIGNPSAMSDLAAGAQLALAALRGSVYTALANLAAINDQEFCRTERAAFDELVARGQEIVDEIEAQYLARVMPQE